MKKKNWLLVIIMLAIVVFSTITMVACGSEESEEIVEEVTIVSVEYLGAPDVPVAGKEYLVTVRTYYSDGSYTDEDVWMTF